MDDHSAIDDIIARVRALQFPPERQKALLHRVVTETWPKRDQHVAITAPVIIECHEVSNAQRRDALLQRLEQFNKPPRRDEGRY